MIVAARRIRFALLLLLVAVAGFPVPAAAAPEARTGELVCRAGDSLIFMPLLTMDVDLQVDGIMAVTRVVQRFRNTVREPLEAVYVFPLPERAAVHRMEIRIGDRRIVSRIQEREQARATYEKARQEGRKTALVEQERPNLFTTSVGNLNPNESVEVVLEYVEEVGYEAGTFRIGFPMTFTPRYVPGAAVTRQEASGEPAVAAPRVPDAARILPPFVPADAARAPRATFHAVLRPGFPVAAVRCPSHAMNVAEHGNVWTVIPAADTLFADRDLVLEWDPGAGGESRTALITQAGDGVSYGLLLLVPPRAEPGAPGLPTRTLFVIDVSGSMAGPSIEQARRALDTALARLAPGDRFDIIAFSDRRSLYRPTWVPADPADVMHARGWVAGLEAEGGTEIHAALLEGLALFDGAFDGVDRIVFLTDGAVGNEDEVLRSVASRLGRVRLHAVGIGHAPNRWFIRELAGHGHGLSTFAFDYHRIEPDIVAFLERIERPVLSGLALDAAGASEVHPQSLPDVHAGEPVFVSLRWDGPPPAAVTLSGRSPLGPYTRRIPSTPAGPGSPGLSTRWARAKVEDLMDGLHGGADPQAVRRDVVAVGIEHHLVTAYTSLVAVEERVTAEGPGRRAEVAAVLPHGSQLLGTLPSGGTLDPLRRVVAALLLVAGAWLFLNRSRPRVARAA